MSITIRLFLTVLMVVFIKTILICNIKEGTLLHSIEKITLSLHLLSFLALNQGWLRESS